MVWPITRVGVAEDEALLGDIAVRERRLRVARRDYTRAHQLNPRETILAELSRNPRSALR
jgi:hypothetical protein